MPQGCILAKLSLQHRVGEVGGRGGRAAACMLLNELQGGAAAQVHQQAGTAGWGDAPLLPCSQSVGMAGIFSCMQHRVLPRCIRQARTAGWGGGPLLPSSASVNMSGNCSASTGTPPPDAPASEAARQGHMSLLCSQGAGVSSCQELAF